jgi:hypothetical protein
VLGSLPISHGTHLTGYPKTMAWHSLTCAHERTRTNACSQACTRTSARTQLSRSSTQSVRMRSTPHAQESVHNSAHTHPQHARADTHTHTHALARAPMHTGTLLRQGGGVRVVFVCLERGRARRAAWRLRVAATFTIYDVAWGQSRVALLHPARRRCCTVAFSYVVGSDAPRSHVALPPARAALG